MHKCLVTNAGSINYTLITSPSQADRTISHLPAHEVFFCEKEGKKILSIYVCNCKFRQREKMNSINSQEAVIADLIVDFGYNFAFSPPMQICKTAFIFQSIKCLQIVGCEAWEKIPYLKAFGRECLLMHFLLHSISHKYFRFARVFCCSENFSFSWDPNCDCEKSFSN